MKGVTVISYGIFSSAFGKCCFQSAAHSGAVPSPPHVATVLPLRASYRSASAASPCTGPESTATRLSASMNRHSQTIIPTEMTVRLFPLYTTMEVGIGYEVQQFSTSTDQPTVRPSAVTTMSWQPTCFGSDLRVLTESSRYTRCALPSFPQYARDMSCADERGTKARSAQQETRTKRQDMQRL